MSLCDVVLSSLCWMTAAVHSGFPSRPVHTAMMRTYQALRADLQFDIAPFRRFFRQLAELMPITAEVAKTAVRRWAHSDQRLFRNSNGEVATWHAEHDGECTAHCGDWSVIV